jgi:hypothetical protein
LDERVIVDPGVYYQYALSKAVLGNWESIDDSVGCDCRRCLDAPMYSHPSSREKPGESILMLLPWRHVGFALKSKKWAQFSMENLKIYGYRNNSLESLVFPDGNETLKSLTMRAETFIQSLRPILPRPGLVNDVVYDKGHQSFRVLMKGLMFPRVTF